MYEQCDSFQEYLTLTLDFKVISIFHYLCCNLHMICNHCGEYVNTKSKTEKGICVLSNKQDPSMFDLKL